MKPTTDCRLSHPYFYLRKKRADDWQSGIYPRHTQVGSRASDLEGKHILDALRVCIVA